MQSSHLRKRGFWGAHPSTIPAREFYPSTVQLSPLTGRPSLGSWLSYGLGSLNDSLPSYVVMTDPRGGPIGGMPAV